MEWLSLELKSLSGEESSHWREAYHLWPILLSDSAMVKFFRLLAISPKVLKWVSFVWIKFGLCCIVWDFWLILLWWVGRVLGRGALSCVFRGKVGVLRTAVAIKKLDKEDKEAAKAFCRELMIASSLHNPNVVPLVGFCIDPEEGLFLVYKFVSGGSLERHLHGMFLYLYFYWEFDLDLMSLNWLCDIHVGREEEEGCERWFFTSMVCEV